jgi:hypothetical protein
MGVWHRYKEAVYVPDESGMCVVVRVWRRRREATTAGLSAMPYSTHHKLYSEAVVTPAVASAEVGQFKEAVQYVHRAAKALYEAAKEVFEQVEVTFHRLVELFVEAVTRVLAWVDEHKAYLFLMAAVALSVALNMWGLVELEKLTHFAMGVPFFSGLADTGGRAAERFRALAERYEKWRVDERLIDGVLKAPLRRERSYTAFLKLGGSRRDLLPPLVELREALKNVKDEVEKDAAVVAALVLYKTLMENAETYGEWAELYRWARSLVGRQAFTVAADDIKRLHEAHNGLVGVAGRVLEELNTVLTLYSKSGFYKEADLRKLKSLLEVDLKRAEGLAEANYTRLSDYSDVGMGTKAYAALLSIARGGLYGHAAMLLMGEGALADIVISTPMGTYKKAKRIAKGRNEAVDPSRLPKGAAGRWEDRAASALLHYLLGSAVNEDLKFRHIGEGFEVFKAYGGVEAHIDTLKIGETTRSKATGEELRRFVDEARRTAPDLSGIKKIWQTLEWLNTDMSFLRGWIVAATAQPWQLAWYIALFGEGKIGRSGANVTRKGGRPNVTMYWPREVLDRIIAEEGEELKPLLCRPVKSWRELVDSIGWSQVLERVEELAGALKPWIGRKEAKDAEREGLVRRMLGELALLVHFAEARKVKDDDKWRKERAVRLSRAVEALSGGRIRGDYADRLVKLIISYAEGYKKKAEERIENLADELSGVSREEVWDLVDFALNDMRCLARDCARDKVVRKLVAPALELIMLDKALEGEFYREETLLWFGEMYATAIAGDGAVGPYDVWLTVGGELGGGTALLRLATLHLLNQLLPKELTFKVRIYVERGRNYNIVATGGDAARFKRFLAVAAPSAGGGH